MTNLVLRGGHVITMDPELGDLPGADVHVAGGRIVAVGPALDASGATEIDARGTIVLPGLVETHWHLWTTLLRAASGEGGPPTGYFRLTRDRGRDLEPGDLAAAVRLACAEAVHSGITTVHDWCHNVRSPEHARAAVEALAASGLRARFGYGYPAGHGNDRAMDLADLAALHAEWPRYAAGGRLTLGVAWRGLGGSNPAMVVPPRVYRAEIEAARGLGLPLSVHASGPRAAAGQIAALAGGGLLGPDVQVVHANSATGTEIRQLADTGATVSLSPYSELLIGYGPPRTGALLAAGVPVGLSVDTTAITGNADPWAIMKLTLALANGAAEDEFALTARRVLAMATLDGARTLGLDGEIGSLTPGKRADLVAVSTDGPHLRAGHDPARLLVTAVQPADVRTVLVDGRVLKRPPGHDQGDVPALS
ncbi:MAG: amidohydrolase family protein [Mycobacteriales bacterium]